MPFLFTETLLLHLYTLEMLWSRVALNVSTGGLLVLTVQVNALAIVIDSCKTTTCTHWVVF